jgi:hypothetical protein
MGMAEGEQLPTLGPTGRDRAIALARGIAGAVPFAGAAIAELITEIVPGQRQERIEDWLRHLAERLVGVEETVLRKRLRKPENVALFEEGAYQAARAFTGERRRQIAELVAGGIADDRRDYVESHRVLRLLEELDDGEVILLAGYLSKNLHGEYWNRHASVMYVPPAHLGSDRDGIDRNTVREAATLHLLRLGLLEGEAGAQHSVGLSSLGRLLLRRIGLAGDDQW